MEKITSTNNEKIISDAKLKDKKHRDARGVYIVEGIKMATEAVKYNQSIEKCYVCEGSEGLEIISTLEKSGVPVFLLAKHVFSKISQTVTPQGVILVIKIPAEKFETLVGNCLLLENLQDPGNVGTLIRTAVAAGVTDCFLVSCADCYSQKAVRSSMSGIYNINIHLSNNLPEEIFTSHVVYCGDMGGEDVFSLENFSHKYVVCVGNEGNGVSKELKAKSHKIVSIPMDDKIESLNAAISGGLLLYTLKTKQIGG
ncbi:MAG: RNA methyltransferase [Bacillota bacterium]